MLGMLCQMLRPEPFIYFRLCEKPSLDYFLPNQFVIYTLLQKIKKSSFFKKKDINLFYRFYTTEGSWINSPRSNLPISNLSMGIEVFPSKINSAINFPVVGASINPCPLNPSDI